jgi:two-component system, OmpR family, response regulator RpaA
MAETNGAPKRPHRRGHDGRLLDAPVLTTGQVARVCGVAARTVTKWTDGGGLGCYRVPASRDRRIPRAALARFLHDHGMAFALARLGLGPDGTRLVVLAGLPGLEVGAVHLGLPGGWRCESVSSLFALGLLLGGVLDATVVLDASLGRSDVLAAGAWLREALPSVRLVGVAGEDDPHPWDGFDVMLRRPVGAEAVLAAVMG